MSLPLAGIRVMEFGGNIAGPSGTWILAELGAEVIKVERPGGGDDARSWGPPFWRETATVFHVINRNKKSVAVDLSNTDERERLKDYIISDVDVVLQNMRPGAIERLGLGADDLLALKAELIFCNLHAFGADGPLADRPGYDALIQAFGGIISVTGSEGDDPVRCGISVIDIGTGMWCAIGILAALNRRKDTGKGGRIDASLFETALTWMAGYIADHQVTGERPKKHGTGVRGITPYRAYDCADGQLIIAAPNDRLFETFAGVLGVSEWVTDVRFATSPARSENKDTLNPMIDQVMRAHDRAYWREKLDDAGIPNAPLQLIDEVIADPQTAALGALQATGDPAMKMMGLPLSFDRERPPLRNVAPSVGEQTEEILGAGK